MFKGLRKILNHCFVDLGLNPVRSISFNLGLIF